MDPIYILDDSLEIEIFYDKDDSCYTDNICLKITESCKDEEKIFRHDENNLYLTPEQAEALAKAITNAVEKSRKSN